MSRYRPVSIIGLGLVAGVAATTPLPAAEPADAPTTLEDIVVTPPVRPLDESTDRLRRLLDETAPCLGCDTAPLVARRTLAERIVRYVFLPTPPAEPDREGRREVELTGQHRGDERGPDMDFIDF